MRTFLFAAIILGLGLVVAPRAVATDYQDGFTCWADDPSCPLGGGGGTNCAPTDECCKCKAACTSQNTADRKTCDGITIRAAKVECYYEADSKKNSCIIQCTIDNKCA